jgi:CDP-6-deoxy-D-xylo-4-hexulose-3-dehydrase
MTPVTTAEPLYPLATSTWDEAEVGALEAVIRGGRFSMGPLVAEYERLAAQLFGCEHAVMVNSGSSANLLAVAAAVLNPDCDLGPGDEVLVPAVSWATTYFPLQQYGLRLVFVDVDLDTLNMDLEAAARAVTPRTKAIFAVNLLGNPNDFKALAALTEEHDLLLLEDNCESLGARIDGRFAGTFGIMGTLSSFFSHHISTMEGGLILTDDPKLHQMLVSLRAHGWTRELPAENLVHPKTGDAFEDLFRFVLPGYNVRPLEMSGAVGVHQLAKVPEIVAGRRANALKFHAHMRSLEGVRLQQEMGESSWFGFSIILEGRLSGRRREVVQALKNAGIEARPIVAGNFTRNPVMRYMNAVVPESLPSADRVHVDGFFVGNHHYPIDAAIGLLHETIRDIR